MLRCYPFNFLVWAMCTQRTAGPPIPPNIFHLFWEPPVVYSKARPRIIYTTRVLIWFIFNNEAGTWNIHKLGSFNETREQGKRPFFNLPRVEFFKACILHISPRQDFNQCEMVLWYWLGPGWSPAAVMERQWEVTLLADRMRFENVSCALGFGVCEASLAYFVISRCLWCSWWKCFTEEVKCLEYKCKNDSGNPLAFPFRY